MLDGFTVQLKQNMNGTGTGSAAWDGGHVLADALQRGGLRVAVEGMTTTDWTWEGKTVVELGSGLGLVGTVVAALGANVLCTDGDVETLGIAEDNLRDNLKRYVEHRSPSASPIGSARTALLPWGIDPEAVLRKAFANDLHGSIPSPNGSFRPVPDVVLAADVIYGGNSEVWHLFLESLASLMGPNTICIFELTERYAHEKRLFLRRLKRGGRNHFGFNAHRLPDDPVLHPRFRGTRVNLYQLTLRPQDPGDMKANEMGAVEPVGRLHKQATKEQLRIASVGPLYLAKEL
jgi:predicted nicotinamide N-methyase